jgi:plastocyanin
MRAWKRASIGVAAMVVALALVGAACGDDDDDDSSSGASTTASTAAASTTAATAASTTTAAGGATTTAAGGGSEAGAGAVTIQGFAFNPQEITVAVGDTVTWTNMDSATHTVTFDEGDDSSGNIANGDTYEETFDTAGTFAYHCSIHSSMTGTVTVS